MKNKERKLFVISIKAAFKMRTTQLYNLTLRILKFLKTKKNFQTTKKKFFFEFLCFCLIII